MKPRINGTAIAAAAAEPVFALSVGAFFLTSVIYYHCQCIIAKIISTTFHHLSSSVSLSLLSSTLNFEKEIAN